MSGMSIHEHLIEWGCPTKYASDRDDVSHAPLASLRKAVSRAANWYPEEDNAVSSMVLAGDSDSLREWDRDKLYQVGLETSDPEDPSGAEEYADDIISALKALADALRESERE